MASFNDFVWWGFLGLITVGLYILGWIGNRMLHEIEKTKDAISKLNESFAILLERDRSHERELEKLDNRVYKLENNKGRRNVTTKRN